MKRKYNKAKRALFILPFLLVMFTACTSDELSYETREVKIALTDDTGKEIRQSGIEVKMTDNRGSVYKDTTDADGIALFRLPDDIYQASVSFSELKGIRSVIYNGITPNIAVNSDLSANIALNISEAGTIIIRELYVGGCRKDDGSGTFQRDKYVILYNNCPQTVFLPNLCLGITTPFNAYGINNNYDGNGNLTYASEDFIPAASAFWYIENVTLKPYQQMVIALNGAVDNTKTYSNSVNLANADYYCTYDPERYDNTLYYPAPSSVIPTSHYLKAIKYGNQNEDAWPLSTSSPAFFVFSLEGTTPVDFGLSADNLWYDGGVVQSSFACKRIPKVSVLDAVEVYSANSKYNEKRLTPDLDAGYIMQTPRQGHALVRRIDKTKTDEVGHDVYVDTNNSTNDFVEKPHASLN